MDKETLQELYWDRGLSEYKISKNSGISAGKIHSLLVNFQIPRRPRYPEPIEEETLKRLYIEEGLSQRDTAKRLDVKINRVKAHLIKYRIPRRECLELTENGLKNLRELHKGKNLSEETRRKLSAHASTRTGERNPSWRGGVSFEPYPPEFNEPLKRKIRERDNYTCQVSGEWGNAVHHIDYDKENNDPQNLITLSKRIHSKTITDREEWTAYFKDLMSKRPDP